MFEKKYTNDTILKEFFYRYDVVGLCENWADFQWEFGSFRHDYTCFDVVRARGGGLRNSGDIFFFFFFFFFFF